MNFDPQGLAEDSRFRPYRLLAISLISALACAVPAGAATLCVDQHGKAGCLSTISGAVAAAAPGDTVQVNPGFYHEDVVITQSVSLVGSGRYHTTIDATGLSNGIFISGPANNSLTQVVIKGFTIQNANFEGILAKNAADVTIFHTIVRGNDQNLDPVNSLCPGQPAFETSEGGDCGQGIHLIGVTHSIVAFNDVEQNAGGILVSDETATSHDDVITRNFVFNNTYKGGITLASHPVYGSTGNTKLAFGVYDNVVSNNDSVHNGFGGAGGGVGIGLYAPGAGNRVFSNSVTGNRLVGNSNAGLAIYNNANFGPSAAAPNPDLNNNSIIGNYIAGNGADPAASVTTPTGISVFGLTPVVDLVVADNMIENEGIDVAWNSESNLNLHLNDLGGGGIGVASLNPVGQVNAREDWWGCPGGPGAQGCSTIQGPANSITYAPWLGWSWNFAHRHDHDHDNDCDHDGDDSHDCDHDGDGGQGGNFGFGHYFGHGQW